MPSERASTGLKIAAAAGMAFLHLPILIIFVYAFTTEEKSYQFPPPGFTLKWFAVVWERQDIWNAMWLSVKVASVATLIALVLGTCAAAAVSNTSGCASISGPPSTTTSGCRTLIRLASPIPR